MQSTKMHERPGAAPEPTIRRLAAPSWAELDEARERHDSAARALRRWQWWFVGMFAVYSVLAGILLFKLVIG